MVGIVRFGKEDCVRSALCQVRYMHTVKCIIGAEPGRTGLIWVFTPGLALFLKPPFLFALAGEVYAHPVAFL